jgi:hypothetical protein
MSTAGATCTARAAGTWPGSSGFSVLRRVDARFDSRLQLLNIRQLLLTGCHGRGDCRRIACPISLRLGQ